MIAHRLIRKYGWECISLDYLKDAFLKSGLGNPGDRNDYEMRYWMWPLVAEIVKKAVGTRRNLIIEGCYIPPGWRRDFGEEYLREIRFICLAMTDAYIDAHFDAVKAHASDIEARLDDTCCTARLLKRDNRAVIEGFTAAGESVTRIEDDYTEAIAPLLR